MKPHLNKKDPNMYANSNCGGWSVMKMQLYTCTHTHTDYRPAVDHHGSPGWLVIGVDSSMESEHWGDVLRHPVIGPRGEVILYNLQRRLGLGGQLEVKGGMEWRWIINRNGNGMTYNEDECSNGVVSEDSLILQDDLEGSVLLRPPLGPVLTTFDPCTLD